jgi:hypothetical protein
MYIIPTMIDLGLLDNQQWPNNVYKKVAQILGLCNNRVTSRDRLIEVVQAVLAIPEDKIATVSLRDCREVYNVPYI